MIRSHPDCWVKDHYEHKCHNLSGKRCLECGAPAGTPWGPYRCPDCDVVHLDKLLLQFEDIRDEF